jgi:hypothetical protein
VFRMLSFRSLESCARSHFDWLARLPVSAVQMASVRLPGAAGSNRAGRSVTLTM